MGGCDTKVCTVSSGERKKLLVSLERPATRPWMMVMGSDVGAYGEYNNDDDDDDEDDASMHVMTILSQG